MLNSISPVIKNIFVVCLIFFGSAAYCQSQVKVKKIWDKAPHNAFTDLIRFKNKFYCVFREATAHYSTQGTANGKIRIIVSKDGNKWESFSLIEKPVFDLRDPNLSVTPDGSLMLMIGIAKYSDGTLLSRHSHVSFLDNSTLKFSDPAPVKYSAEVIENSDNPIMNWLWRVVWHDGRSYGVIYEEFDKEGKPLVNNKLNMVSSADGIHYELVKSFSIQGKPDETSLRFRPDGELYVLIRMESPPPNQNGLLGRSKYPYEDWEIINTGIKIGGPNLIFTDKGNILVGTRTYSGTNMKTALFGTDAEGQFKQLIEFPSDGDTSYPGMVFYNDNLYFSYYSSHEEGKSNIYFSKIPMKYIRKLNGAAPASPFK